jgi:hypothetical protein
MVQWLTGGEDGRNNEFFGHGASAARYQSGGSYPKNVNRGRDADADVAETGHFPQKTASRRAPTDT